jgi:molybdate transport system permease protein
MGSLLTGHDTLTALWLTLVTSIVTVVMVVMAGTPLAYVLARSHRRGVGLLRAGLMIPLILPPVVAGVALLAAFGRTSLLGSWLDSTFGVTLPFTTVAVVMAHTFVALPFYVLAVEGALSTIDEDYDVAAAALGADRWTTFTRVTLPMALPGVAAGAALAWARSIGEFGATITFAGNYPGVTQTFPLAIYGALQLNTDTAIALSVVLLVVSVAVLFLLRGRWVGGLTR